MACFLIPAGEAIVTAVAAKAVRSKEKKAAQAGNLPSQGKLPFSRKLKWLSNLLWGGSALLAFEHVWHGEVTPFFPFLTSAADPVSAAAMVREMLTAGVAMAVFATAVWGVMLAVSAFAEKKDAKARESAR